MLRAALLASPLVLALVSCGDSASSFDDSTLLNTTGATSSSGGEGTGARSSLGGSSSGAGNNSSAGTDNGNAGSDSTGGTGTNGGSSSGSSSSGGKGGSGNDGGSSSGGKGGSGNDAGNAGTGNGGTDNGGNGNNAGNGGTSQAGNGGTGQAGSSSGAGMGGMAGAAGTSGATCPDVFGNYDIVDTMGACNGFNKEATQSIQGTDVACFAHFVSPSAGGNAGINGGAIVNAEGSFSGASLAFGKTERMPCSGAWNQIEERMTVKCGLQNEACTVVMHRK